MLACLVPKRLRSNMSSLSELTTGHIYTNCQPLIEKIHFGTKPGHNKAESPSELPPPKLTPYLPSSSVISAISYILHTYSIQPHILCHSQNRSQILEGQAFSHSQGLRILHHGSSNLHSNLRTLSDLSNVVSAHQECLARILEEEFSKR